MAAGEVLFHGSNSIKKMQWLPIFTQADRCRAKRPVCISLAAVKDAVGIAAVLTG
jgi:hypothetical protein